MCKAQETQGGINTERMTVLLAEDGLGRMLEQEAGPGGSVFSWAVSGGSVHMCVLSKPKRAEGAV